VNDWDDDELIIGDSDAAAADLPLVLDKKECPGLQVCFGLHIQPLAINVVFYHFSVSPVMLLNSTLIQAVHSTRSKYREATVALRVHQWQGRPAA